MASPTPMAGTVAGVFEASPTVNVGAALNAQLGLWRRLDLVLERVVVGERPLHRVRVTADDVRVVDALPQRIGAKEVELVVDISGDQIAIWVDALAPGIVAWVDEGKVVARHPKYQRWGDVILEPWVRGREIGAVVVATRIWGRRVGLPGRLRREFTRELSWLPEGTELTVLELLDSGGAQLRAAIVDFDVSVDVPRLLTDLSARGTQRAVKIMTGRL